jgi:hypothetical protein
LFFFLLVTCAYHDRSSRTISEREIKVVMLTCGGVSEKEREGRRGMERREREKRARWSKGGTRRGKGRRGRRRSSQGGRGRRGHLDILKQDYVLESKCQAASSSLPQDLYHVSKEERKTRKRRKQKPQRKRGYRGRRLMDREGEEAEEEE